MGLRALQMLILDIHELTVEAMVRKDRSLLLRALAMDPLVNSIATAEAVLNDLHRAQAEVLDDWVAGQETGGMGNKDAVKPSEVPQLY